jgi:hypothetical protein
MSKAQSRAVFPQPNILPGTVHAHDCISTPQRVVSARGAASQSNIASESLKEYLDSRLRTRKFTDSELVLQLNDADETIKKVLKIMTPEKGGRSVVNRMSAAQRLKAFHGYLDNLGKEVSFVRRAAIAIQFKAGDGLDLANVTMHLHSLKLRENQRLYLVRNKITNCYRVEVRNISGRPSSQDIIMYPATGMSPILRGDGAVNNEETEWVNACGADGFEALAVRLDEQKKIDKFAAHYMSKV